MSTEPTTPLEMLARAAEKPCLLTQCLEELARCDTTAMAKALGGTALAGDLLPLVVQQARHIAAAKAHLRSAIRDTPQPIQGPPPPPPPMVHSMRTRGFDCAQKFYQDSKIRFSIVVEGPGTLTAQLRLRGGQGQLVDELLRGTSTYPVRRNGECLVDDTSIAGLSSKNGGSFRFQIEVRASDGTTVLAGLTPPFQVWTKRLKFKPSLESLRASDVVTHLPAIGPTYAQKLRDAYGVVTIGDFAALDPALAPVICAKIRKERGILRAQTVVDAILLARQISRQ